MKSLIQDEQKGSIMLPAKFGSTSTSVTLAESWLPYGVPFVFVAGLILGEVATDKDAIIPLFKRMIIRNGPLAIRSARF